MLWQVTQEPSSAFPLLQKCAAAECLSAEGSLHLHPVPLSLCWAPPLAHSPVTPPCPRLLVFPQLSMPHLDGAPGASSSWKLSLLLLLAGCTVHFVSYFCGLPNWGAVFFPSNVQQESDHFLSGKT